MSKNRIERDGIDADAFRGFHILDPSLDDETYWARFRVRVMTRAADELFRRRIAADISVVGVMEGWSRTLVPAAAIAAVMAGFILLSDYQYRSGPADLEEILLADLVDPVLPTSGETGTVTVRFASEGF
jgi:hypothetical protein